MKIINISVPFAQAHQGDDLYDHHMMGCCGGFSGTMGGWGTGAMLLLWILLLAGLIYLAKYIFSNERRGDRDRKALDILEERYAKGEIDKEEFESRKKDLG